MVLTLTFYEEGWMESMKAVMGLSEEEGIGWLSFLFRSKVKLNKLY